MRAAVARRGQMVVEDIGDPVPASGEALVAVRACGICGSDLHTLRHAHSMLALASMTGAEEDRFSSPVPGVTIALPEALTAK